MKNKLLILPLLIFLGCNTVPEQEDYPGTIHSFYVPETVSEEAQQAIGILERVIFPNPAPDDLEGWDAAVAAYEDSMVPLNESALAALAPGLEEIVLGGIQCIDIKPAGWQDNNKVLVYVHGGAYTFLTAASTLVSAVPIAHETGLRIVSVDYALAPRGDFNTITDQAIAVVEALYDQGYTPGNVAIYGESAGGGLAAGMTLKMRDQGIPLPGALVLLCPWADITDTGDSYHILKDADPYLYYEGVLGNSAEAYAPKEDQKNPYVSPVYGDFTPGFPPTFIEIGTKEIFLSNAVRLYQKLDLAGIPVKLDVYEGMYHAFHIWNWDLEESYILRKKIALFLEQYLN